MCVIVYKPRNAKLPDIQTLKKCFNHNDDGAGYAIRFNNRVFYKKGFMSFDDFEKELNKQHRLFKENDVVIHFRLGSPTVNYLTHPFPLSKDNELLSLSGIERKGVLFHNGVIPYFSFHYCFYFNKNKKKINESLSDTAFLALIIRELDLNIKQIKTLVNILSPTDRFLIMTPDNIIMIGEWHEKNGVFFSNLLFEKEILPKTFNLPIL